MLFTIYCIINYLHGKMDKHNNKVDNHNNEVDKQHINQSRIFVPPMYYNFMIIKQICFIFGEGKERMLQKQ